MCGSIGNDTLCIERAAIECMGGECHLTEEHSSRLRRLVYGHFFEKDPGLPYRLPLEKQLIQEACSG